MVGSAGDASLVMAPSDVGSADGDAARVKCEAMEEAGEGWDAIETGSVDSRRSSTGVSGSTCPVVGVTPSLSLSSLGSPSALFKAF